MYRIIFCKITLLALITGLLSACGQSGALVSPSDPNYDKRSNYLLYRHAEQVTVQPAEATPNTTTTSTEQN